MKLESEFSKLAREGAALLEVEDYAGLASRYREWSLRALNSLIELFGRDSELTRDFINDKAVAEELISKLAARGALSGISRFISSDARRLRVLTERQLGVLEAASAAAESEVPRLKNRLKRRILLDLLRSAEKLLRRGLKDPAAVLCGEVLVELLRGRCDALGIDYSPEDSAGTLIALLKERGESVSHLEAFAAIGEAAAEGSFFSYTRSDVQRMLEELRGMVEGKSTTSGMD
ncbi:MAG: hypothetical protein GXO66_02700 [Euryarchaeota archaeon]|nr:hypothetical protein [Euryarchaeota archaeon]